MPAVTPCNPAAVLPRRAALAVLAGAGAALALPRRTFAQPAAPAPFIDPRAFGARLDGATDDTAALQRAIDEAGRTGRTLFLPAGRALVSDPDRDGACLRLTRAITITGEGALRSCLVPVRGLPPSAAALAIAPDPGFAADHLTLSAFAIALPDDGRRGGGPAIAALTGRGTGPLPKLTIRDLFVGLGAGPAILHRNDRAAQPTGGLYGAAIENCQLRGSVRLEGSGDSNRIIGCIVSGPGVGIFAHLIEGAALLSVTDCNITADDGGLDVAGDAILIERSIIEHSAPGPAGGALVRVGAPGRRSRGCRLAHCVLSAFGQSRASHLVRATGTDGLSLAGNLFLSGQAGRQAIRLEADCRDTLIGPNGRNANVPADPPGLAASRTPGPDFAIDR
jgi:hypothetical protein